MSARYDGWVCRTALDGRWVRLQKIAGQEPCSLCDAAAIYDLVTLHSGHYADMSYCDPCATAEIAAQPHTGDAWFRPVEATEVQP